MLMTTVGFSLLCGAWIVTMVAVDTFGQVACAARLQALLLLLLHRALIAAELATDSR
jgi:hypothetical protein